MPPISTETRSARASPMPPWLTATSVASTRPMPPWRTSTCWAFATPRPPWLIVTVLASTVSEPGPVESGTTDPDGTESTRVVRGVRVGSSFEARLDGGRLRRLRLWLGGARRLRGRSGRGSAWRHSRASRHSPAWRRPSGSASPSALAWRPSRSSACRSAGCRPWLGSSGWAIGSPPWARLVVYHAAYARLVSDAPDRSARMPRNRRSCYPAPALRRALEDRGRDATRTRGFDRCAVR